MAQFEELRCDEVPPERRVPSVQGLCEAAGHHDTRADNEAYRQNPLGYRLGTQTRKLHEQRAASSEADDQQNTITDQKDCKNGAVVDGQAGHLEPEDGLEDEQQRQNEC